MEIKNQFQLLDLLKEFTAQKKEYDKVLNAMNEVRKNGYAVVMPDIEDVDIKEPQIVKHGNKYGVEIKADSPSIHLIKANVGTKIAPIVGSEQQAVDLIQYIKEEQTSGKGIWEINIFGKTVEQLVKEGIHNKIESIGEDSQKNLQETMQKILNESNGGMIFIII